MTLFHQRNTRDYGLKKEKLYMRIKYIVYTDKESAWILKKGGEAMRAFPLFF